MGTHTQPPPPVVVCCTVLRSFCDTCPCVPAQRVFSLCSCAERAWCVCLCFYCRLAFLLVLMLFFPFFCCGLPSRPPPTVHASAPPLHSRAVRAVAAPPGDPPMRLPSGEFRGLPGAPHPRRHARGRTPDHATSPSAAPVTGGDAGCRSRLRCRRRCCRRAGKVKSAASTCPALLLPRGGVPARQLKSPSPARSWLQAPRPIPCHPRLPDRSVGRRTRRRRDRRGRARPAADAPARRVTRGPHRRQPPPAQWAVAAANSAW